MRPLKIAFFTTFYPPYHFGGDAIGVERLVKALARRGCDITVVHDIDAFRTLRGPAPKTMPRETANVRVIGLESRVPVVSNLLTHQLGQPIAHGGQIDEILAEGAFDVIWHNNVSLVGGPGLLKKGDALKVYEAHEHWLVCPTHVLWRYGQERCDEKKCLSCSISYGRPPQLWRLGGQFDRALDAVDLFIAKSDFSRKKHAEFGFKREMTVVPYFLPDAPPTEEKTARPQERPYFLFVGRLEKIKGLQDVIPVFQSYQKADLVVVGAGEYETALKSLAAENPRVKFLGRKAPEEIAQYYEHAEALVVPSLCYETFGIIIIEAFRAGAPVIARRLGPFPEIIDACDGGLMFETQDELVAALDAVVAAPEHRRALAIKARQGFDQRWSESVVVDRYFSELRRAAEQRGDRSLSKKLEAY